jgi:hypothetical protein
MRATHEGERQFWMQQISSGVLLPETKRQWLISDDERLCPICRPLNGEQATLNGLFAGGYLTPPAHPRCRCSQFLVAPVVVPRKQVTEGAPPLRTAPTPKPVKPPVAKFSYNLIKYEESKEFADKINDAKQITESEINRLRAEFPKLKNMQIPRVQIMHGTNIDRDNKKLGKFGDGFLGLYWPSEQTIAMPSHIERGETKLTLGQPRTWHVVENPTYQNVFRHEVGHYVNMTMHKTSVQYEWAQLWDKTAKTNDRRVSTYAATNVQEYFAESFAAYTHPSYGKTGQPKLPPEIEAYMVKHVGKRKETK